MAENRSPPPSRWRPRGVHDSVTRGNVTAPLRGLSQRRARLRRQAQQNLRMCGYVFSSSVRLPAQVSGCDSVPLLNFQTRRIQPESSFWNSLTLSDMASAVLDLRLSLQVEELFYIKQVNRSS